MGRLKSVAQKNGVPLVPVEKHSCDRNAFIMLKSLEAIDMVSWSPFFEPLLSLVPQNAHQMPENDTRILVAKSVVYLQVSARDLLVFQPQTSGDKRCCYHIL